jgi:hypothetical protein
MFSIGSAPVDAMTYTDEEELHGDAPWLVEERGRWSHAGASGATAVRRIRARMRSPRLTSTTPAITTTPPSSSPTSGTSPSQMNPIRTANAGTRYSSEVEVAIGRFATAYPQRTNPSAEGSRPR